jgi:hypothetical protein
MAAERPYFTRLMEAAGNRPRGRFPPNRLSPRSPISTHARGRRLSSQFRAECPKSGCACQPASKRPLGPATPHPSVRWGQPRSSIRLVFADRGAVRRPPPAVCRVRQGPTRMAPFSRNRKPLPVLVTVHSIPECTKVRFGIGTKVLVLASLASHSGLKHSATSAAARNRPPLRLRAVAGAGENRIRERFPPGPLLRPDPRSLNLKTAALV